jgi:Ser-tRNA(Ala) deacylase AlaX
MNTEAETRLAYWDDSYRFEDEAKVTSVIVAADGRTAITLDCTIFHPQGGGQPADNGFIHSEKGRFAVSDVRLIDGQLLHFGNFEEGSFAQNEVVKLEIMKERRMLNARLHSSGHLIDVAIQRLGLTLKPGKGYHFPDGPHVEYEGRLDSIDKDQLLGMIQTDVQGLIELNLPVRTVYALKQDDNALYGDLPGCADPSKPIRIVAIGDNPGCPCGGTHVKELKDLGHLEISKIRTKADKVKISYLVK